MRLLLENMDHRGACGYEPNTGDGAGIMIQIPHELFYDECLQLGIALPAIEEYAVGMIFFPKDIKKREECRDIFTRAAQKMGMKVIRWRNVPVNPDGVGSSALAVEPDIEQVFLQRPDKIKTAEAFERKLFVLRKYATHMTTNTVKKDPIGFYINSLS